MSLHNNRKEERRKNFLQLVLSSSWWALPMNSIKNRLYCSLSRIRRPLWRLKTPGTAGCPSRNFPSKGLTWRSQKRCKKVRLRRALDKAWTLGHLYLSLEFVRDIPSIHPDTIRSCWKAIYWISTIWFPQNLTTLIAMFYYFWIYLQETWTDWFVLLTWYMMILERKE